MTALRGHPWGLGQQEATPCCARTPQLLRNTRTLPTEPWPQGQQDGTRPCPCSSGSPSRARTAVWLPFLPRTRAGASPGFAQPRGYTRLTAAFPAAQGGKHEVSGATHTLPDAAPAGGTVIGPQLLQLHAAPVLTPSPLWQQSLSPHIHGDRVPPRGAAGGAGTVAGRHRQLGSSSARPGRFPTGSVPSPGCSRTGAELLKGGLVTA